MFSGILQSKKTMSATKKQAIEKATNTASEIADYFIAKANQGSKPISNKKLQKLVYYSQAWSIVLNNKKLFPEKIEAWVHGPAIRTLYVKYKEFGFSPIKKEIEKEAISGISTKDKKLLDEVWSVYGNLDAGYLEMLTHSERPWQEAREGLQGHESSENEIAPTSLRDYYLAKLVEAKKA